MTLEFLQLICAAVDGCDAVGVIVFALSIRWRLIEEDCDGSLSLTGEKGGGSILIKVG